jgi:hypothetical protein
MPAGGGGAILANLWTGDPMTVALLDPAFVPNYDTQKAWADVSAHEVAGTGYAAGGILLTGKAAPYDTVNDLYNLQAASVVWGPGATFNAGFALVYDNSGTKPLWSLVDFQGTKTVSNGTFEIDWAALGLLSVAAVET